MSLSVLLLCLLWSLVEVHSQTVPFHYASLGVRAFPNNSHVEHTLVRKRSGAESVYLSLNGRVIPNNGYVVISDIGTAGDDTALLCITNRPPPTGSSHSGGNWFAPDGTRVESSGNAVPGVRRNRGPMVIRLYRNTSTGPPAEGIYYCRIQDDMEDLQAMLVGLYNGGGGNAFCIGQCIMRDFFRSHHNIWWCDCGL